MMTFFAPKTELIKIQIIARVDGVTVAEITTPLGNKFQGVAKKHPTDTYNRYVGDSLAVARALRKYAAKLESLAR